MQDWTAATRGKIQKSEILLRRGGDFLTGGGNLRSDFDNSNLLQSYKQLWTTFCKYWTSIIIKISMSVYKEYKMKIKMVLEQWLQLKTIFGGYNMKIVI